MPRTPAIFKRPTMGNMTASVNPGAPRRSAQTRAYPARIDRMGSGGVTTASGSMKTPAGSSVEPSVCEEERLISRINVLRRQNVLECTSSDRGVGEATTGPSATAPAWRAAAGPAPRGRRRTGVGGRQRRPSSYPQVTRDVQRGQPSPIDSSSSRTRFSSSARDRGSRTQDLLGPARLE